MQNSKEGEFKKSTMFAYLDLIKVWEVGEKRKHKIGPITFIDYLI